MNWIMVAAGILMLGAMTWELMFGNPKLAGIYLSYGVANFILATMK